MLVADKFEIDDKEISCKFSIEYLQDVEIQMRLLRQFRTTEITDEEVAVWKAIYFGFDPVSPAEYDQSEEAVTWREIIGCSGPGYRCPILTGPITEKEIDEWHNDYKNLKEVDFAALRKKYNVKFESDEEPPYQDYGDGYYFQPTAPIQWPAESTIFPWIEETPIREILDSFLRQD